MVSDGNGFLYVNSGQAPNSYLSRVSISGNGAVDASWQPAINGWVRALALAGSQTLIVGGDFNAVQGVPRAHVAKLSVAPGAAVDLAWNPGTDGPVSTALETAGSVYLGGNFRTVGGQPRLALARVAASGAGTVEPWAPAANGGYVDIIEIDAAGNIHVGGGFTQVAAQDRSALAVFLLGSTALRTASDVEIPGSVFDVARQSGGGLILGGRFSRVGSLARQNLLRLKADGAVDPDWRADACGLPVPNVGNPGDSPYYWDNWVTDLTIDTDERIYASGSFDSVAGTARGKIARLSATGQLDQDWNPNANGIVSAMVLDGSDRIYVGGNFSTIGGQARGNLARISAADGAADPAWTASTGLGSEIYALALSSNSLFIGGGFDTVNGESCCSAIAKLSTAGSGSRDTNWNVRLTGGARQVSELMANADDLYIAGAFDGLQNGASSISNRSLARVSASSGALDPLWNPQIGLFDGVLEVQLSGDGRLFASGYRFNSYDGGVLAFSTTGSGATDPSWRVATNKSAGALLTVGNTLYVGGSFSRISGTSRHGLAAFAKDGLFGDGLEAAD